MKDKILLVVSLWLTLSIIFLLIPQASADSHSLSRWITYFFPLTRLFDFFIGILLGLVFLEVKERLSKYSNQIFGIFEFVSIILLIAVVFYSPNIEQNLRYSLFFLPFWSMLIFIFAFQRGAVSRVLSNKVLVYLGEISFSFYMVHNLVLVYAQKFGFEHSSALVVTVCFLISLSLSAVLYHFYEEPMRQKLRSKLESKLSNLKKVFLKAS
ncbi:acyltransferase family protein [Peribacillus asahii]|uniref:acyltransferase family protein n=1 Tax=Peribacillus asahii TaxID=228899 RepID=UPI0038186499